MVAMLTYVAIVALLFMHELARRNNTHYRTAKYNDIRYKLTYSFFKGL